MSDKPKPGKDKDLRYIRQAMEATQLLFGFLSDRGLEPDAAQHAGLLTEAFLLAADQLDQLAQMLDNSASGSLVVIEQNRELRRLLRLLLRQNGSNGCLLVMRMAEAAGNQLSALLVVHEIRSSNR